MNWHKLLSAKRFGLATEAVNAPLYRNAFNKDQDRILFAKSFRRLGRKTQVHPLPTIDHIHNRLSHSLEVGCVARSLGSQVGMELSSSLPEHISPLDLGLIAQNAGLAHDIGNPPFGHGGEQAISDWFKSSSASPIMQSLSYLEKQDLMHFEGNAQGLRLITKMEYHHNDGGMRLTYATLGAMIKYPSSLIHQAEAYKFGAFQTEIDSLRHIAKKLGLLKLDTEKWSRHPLVYLVEAADDICYALLDLEDALDLGLLQWSDVKEVFGLLTSKLIETKDEANVALLRGIAMERAINSVVEVFLNKEKQLLNGKVKQPLLSLVDADIKEGVFQAKQIAAQKVFASSEKTLMEIAAYEVLSSLLERFCTSAYKYHQGEELTYKDKRVINLLGEFAPTREDSLYESYRKILDFISNLSDQAAVRLAEQLKGKMSAFLT